MSGGYMNCIDLDAIKTDLERQLDRSNPNWSFARENACYDLLEYLAKFPVIDPVKHGKWINGDCSECGFSIPTDDRIDYIAEADVHYCYNCGAKMDGETNG